MTIVLCGGGSGGHITPLLAVAKELKTSSATELKLVYVGEKRGKFSHIAEESGLFDECFYISAGKFRRYHNDTFLTKLADVKTMALNMRDLFRLGAGVVQAYFLFKKLKPASVMLKGGYVCVPASIGAYRSGARIITHDSDAVPGLSNRFAARYASVHATGMPTRYYGYPEESARYVGIPISDNYREYSDDEIRFLKEKYNIPENAQVLLLTGGSNGARRLNNWTISAIKDLMPSNPNLYAILVIGKGNSAQVEQAGLPDEILSRIIVHEFSSEMFHLSATADVIICRAGATALAEFGAQSKACIIIPSPDLAGGHQMKNAVVYQDQHAAIVIEEASLKQSVEPLANAISRLLNNKAERKELGQNLHGSMPSQPAAKILAGLLLEDKK